mmetsp:Transcript_26875/g.61957  ORF Transcript_26875/g.61957 Transcript_26875/m.61957 type:complete len:311 (-) Transcript_26875:722-1654(-)
MDINNSDTNRMRFSSTTIQGWPEKRSMIRSTMSHTLVGRGCSSSAKRTSAVRASSTDSQYSSLSASKGSSNGLTRATSAMPSAASTAALATRAMAGRSSARPSLAHLSWCAPSKMRPTQREPARSKVSTTTESAQSSSVSTTARRTDSAGAPDPRTARVGAERPLAARARSSARISARRACRRGCHAPWSCAQPFITLETMSLAQEVASSQASRSRTMASSSGAGTARAAQSAWQMVGALRSKSTSSMASWQRSARRLLGRCCTEAPGRRSAPGRGPGSRARSGSRPRRGRRSPAARAGRTRAACSCARP